jgi:hypothetical protein
MPSAELGQRPGQQFLGVVRHPVALIDRAPGGLQRRARLIGVGDLASVVEASVCLQHVGSDLPGRASRAKHGAVGRQGLLERRSVHAPRLGVGDRAADPRRERRFAAPRSYLF